MQNIVNISGRMVGNGQLCLIIAEAGINHNGDLSLARELVYAAAEAKADVIKFQTHFPEHEMLRDGISAGYVGEPLFDLLTRTALSKDAHFELKELAEEKLGIMFLSTPFSREAADFLEELGVAAFKTGSGELTNIPLQLHIARKVKPMIISTGMSRWDEIITTANLIVSIGAPFILLHCVSLYPSDYSHLNLGVIAKMKERFNVPVGLSDHTLGIYTAFAGAALGANVIEKHFTMSRKLSGPDQSASIEPNELLELVIGVRAIEAALGSEKQIQPGEDEVRKMAHHSVVSLRNMQAGKIIDEKDVWVKRPGVGVPAKYLPQFIGRKLKRDIPKDSLLKWEDLE